MFANQRTEFRYTIQESTCEAPMASASVTQLFVLYFLSREVHSKNDNV